MFKESRLKDCKEKDYFALDTTRKQKDKKTKKNVDRKPKKNNTRETIE